MHRNSTFNWIKKYLEQFSPALISTKAKVHKTSTIAVLQKTNVPNKVSTKLENINSPRGFNNANKTPEQPKNIDENCNRSPIYAHNLEENPKQNFNFIQEEITVNHQEVPVYRKLTDITTPNLASQGDNRNQYKHIQKKKEENKAMPKSPEENSENNFTEVQDNNLKGVQKTQVYGPIIPPNGLKENNIHLKEGENNTTKNSNKLLDSVYSPQELKRNDANFHQTDKEIQSGSINALKSSVVGPKFFCSSSFAGVKLDFLIDSGSQVNIISSLQVPNRLLKNLLPTDSKITSYSGDNINVLGYIIEDIMIGNIKIEETPIYVCSSPFQAILGTPGILGGKLKINLTENTLEQEINGRSSKEPLHQKSTMNIQNYNINLLKTPRGFNKRRHDAYSIENRTIPARSECILSVQVDEIKNVNGYFTPEPFNSGISDEIILAKSVSKFTPLHNTSIIRVCNLSQTPFLIREGQKVAELCPVEIPANLPAKSNPSRIKDVLNQVTVGTKKKYAMKEAKDLLIEFSDVFATDNDSVQQTSEVRYDINTGDVAPVAQQRYKTPYYLREEMKKIIAKNIETGLMEECSSPWAAPVLLVKKPNGSWRLVCDYRKLNNVTITDSYPLPEINDLITALSESRIFSSSDLWSGFHQIKTTEQAKQKLAVITEFGQFTWRVMPMGGKNCPAVFQRLMDTCFRSMPRSQLIIYLDDILIHGLTEKDNLASLRQVFKLLRKNNLKLRADKTKILMDEIKFCGFIIKDGCKKPNPEKVKAVRNLQAPTNPQGAQELFGMLNYHRSFIPQFAKKAAPISKTYNIKPFCWTDEANNAMKILINEICNTALELQIPKMKNATFVLETDASDIGYGACLFVCTKAPKHNKHTSSCLKPMEYMSKMFTPAQMKYYTQEKELFAGKEALKKWSQFLLGRKFLWRMDNACVKWAYRVTSTNRKISQWLAEISDFDIVTELKSSSQMKISDCLSRNFINGNNALDDLQEVNDLPEELEDSNKMFNANNLRGVKYSSEEDKYSSQEIKDVKESDSSKRCELNAIQVRRNEISNLQDNDPTLKQVRRFVKNDRWPKILSDIFKPYAELRSKLEIGSNDELFLRTDEEYRIIPPKSIQHDILKAYHTLNGHPGIEQTIQQLNRVYFWPTLQEDARLMVRTCHNCQINKPNLHPKKPPLGELYTPSQPYEMYAFDLIGPLPITEEGYRFALVGIDIFSKKVYARCLFGKHAEGIRKEIQSILLKNPNLPRLILTDNGLEFNSLKSFCSDYGIKHVNSAPYHPQTNGCCERANQTLKQKLFSSGRENEWDQRLDITVHWINTCNGTTTKISPYAIETGFNGQVLEDPLEHPSKRLDVRDLSRNTHARIISEKKNRLEENKNDLYVPFKVGDLVLAKNMVGKRPRFLDIIYEVIEVRSNGLSFKIKDIASNSTAIRFVTQLKPYNMNQFHFDNAVSTDEENSASDDEDTDADNICEYYDEDDDSCYDFCTIDDPNNLMDDSYNPSGAKDTTTENYNTTTENNNTTTENNNTTPENNNYNPLGVLNSSCQEDSYNPSRVLNSNEQKNIYNPSSSHDNPLDNPENIEDYNDLINQDSQDDLTRSQVSDRSKSADQEIVNPSEDKTSEDTLKYSFGNVELPNLPSDQNTSNYQDALDDNDGNFEPMSLDELDQSLNVTGDKVINNAPQKTKKDIDDYMTLEEFSVNQINQLAKQFNIPVSGLIENKKSQVRSHFDKKYEAWPRDAKGNPVFYLTSFTVEREQSISDLRKSELKALVQVYKLPPPQMSSKLLLASFRKHVDREIRKLYPTHAVDEDGELLFKPSTETLTNIFVPSKEIEQLKMSVSTSKKLLKLSKVD